MNEGEKEELRERGNEERPREGKMKEKRERGRENDVKMSGDS